MGCKYEFQCSQPQWFTEAALRDHLAGQGVQVEFGVEATSIVADNDGVTVTLDKSGRKEVVRADYLIGAGGGHDLTRHSMDEHLDGETYGGRFIVADVKLTLPAPPGRARIIVGPSGFVLLAPLPEGRWLIFVNRDEDDQGAEPPSAAKLAGAAQRLGSEPTSDSPICAGLRTSRCTSALSRPSATAGASCWATRDIFQARWAGKGSIRRSWTARTSRGNWPWSFAARPSPRCSQPTPIERGLADRHVLEVSNEIHGVVMQLVEKCRAGEALSLPAQDPAEALAGLRKRSMLDVSYKGSLLVDGSAGERRAQRQERAFPAGAISTERPTISSFPAARRGSTISERAGALSSSVVEGTGGASSRNRRG